MTTTIPVRLALALVGAITILAGTSAASAQSAPLAHGMRPASLVAPLVIRYPDMLHSANVEGRVIIDVGVDTAGKLDWSRSRVRSDSHELFVAAVKNGLKPAAWHPATRDGERVPGLWRDTVDFVLLPSDSASCRASSLAHQYICARPVIIDRINLSMSGDERRRWRDSLVAGRKRWAAARPRAYEIEITEGCFCLGSLGPIRIVVTVRGDSIAGVRRTKAPEARSVASMQFWHVWTVDSLFTAADEELALEGRFVEAFELDPRYGFPRRVHTDVHYVTDSWTRLDVRSFVPLNSPPR